MSKLSPLLSALCEIVATQNWMFVLILVPVSLSYDMLDYSKYKPNLILNIANEHIMIRRSKIV